MNKMLFRWFYFFFSLSLLQQNNMSVLCSSYLCFFFSLSLSPDLFYDSFTYFVLYVYSFFFAVRYFGLENIPINTSRSHRQCRMFLVYDFATKKVDLSSSIHLRSNSPLMAFREKSRIEIRPSLSCYSRSIFRVFRVRI